MKEITLKEWSAYLPYGLKVKVTDNPCADEIHELSGIPYDGLLHLGKGGMYGFKRRNFKQVKPILYDLSWLTREITHEGETFIPLYKLQKIDKAFVLTFIETFGYEELKVEVFELLLEWRFNVFSLPDELIVRVSEDFNPYK